MVLTLEEIKELKSQLSQQIQHLPPDKKTLAQEQIDKLTSEDLEELIRQQQSKSGKESKTIFRMIVDKNIDSFIISDTKDALAVLDINPVSHGHSLVIPKQAVKDPSSIPVEVYAAAKDLAKLLVEKLKASSADVQTETKFGEAILHVIPSYEKKVSLSSPRQEAKKEELENIAKKLKKEEKKQVIVPRKIEKIRVLMKWRIP